MKVSIQISAEKIRPKVSGDNTINIHHWYYLKNDLISKLFRFGRAQKVEKAVHEPTALSFPWVQSTDNETYLF